MLLFEREQQAQVGEQADQQVFGPVPFGVDLLHPERADVIDHGRDQDQHDIAGPPAHVKIVAARQQKIDPETLWQEEVNYGDNREKNQKLQ